MTRLIVGLAIAVGLVPAGAAVAAITGLGVERGLASGHVGAAAALVTILPIAGLWSLFGRSGAALAGALLVWPPLVLLGLPGYFPGEVPGAIATGFSVYAAAGGRDAAVKAAQLGARVGGAVEVAPAGEPPVPEAERPAPDCPPPTPVGGADVIALPYEGTGHSMAIPVAFGEVELPMLFDTGASLTTLNRASLRAIGVSVPPDAPEITLRTANGERTARLVLVPEAWVGGMLVEGVTVGICEECADDHTRGLLGLNVSGQFLVTVDTRRKEVLFQNRGGEAERLVDIAPWLRVSAQATVWPDGRVEVEVRGENAAARAVSEAVVGIACEGEPFLARLRDIPAEGEASTTVRLPRGTDCHAYRVTLDGARW